MSRMPERRPTIQVSEELLGSVSATPALRIVPLPVGPISQFDSVDTRFFDEGDEISRATGPTEAFEDLTSSPPRSKRWSRALPVIGVAAAILVATGGIAYRRATRHSGDMARMATLAEAAAQQAVATLAVSRRQPAAVPTPPIAIVAAPPVTAPPVVPAPAVPTPARAAVEASSSPAPAVAPVIARSMPSPPLAMAGAIAPATHEADSEADQDAKTPTSLAIVESCRKAFHDRRAKDVLETCALAFTQDPRSAEVAVMLAKTEFDRGRSRQALDWARKAVAIDENHADAYVYMGGAEQAAGHSAAAKFAYKRYLQLAPRGRFAADLRAVLRSL
jgi:hypothetical protein